MPITLDGTLGVGTPGITLAGSAITASANQLNNASEDMDAENRIINGNFFYWQRGTSFSTNVYGADRWVNSFNGGTVTQSQQAFAHGDMLGVNNPALYLRQSVSGQTLTSHYAATTQRIEGFRSYAGQTITVMGWARRFSGTGNMVIEGEQIFGVGGSATLSGISPTTITLGATWAPFAAVMTIPSVTGKTIGTGNPALWLNFWISGGSDYSSRNNAMGLQTIAVDFWGIHIRQGTWSVADVTLYRERDRATELALCQRYFEASITYIYGAAVPAGQQPLGGIYFATPKRAVPTFAWGAELQSVNASSRTVDFITTIGARAYVTAVATGNTAYTTYISFDAEV